MAQCLGHARLIKGKTIGLDATTLEANAALRSIVGARLGAADLSLSVVAGLAPLGLIKAIDAGRAVTPGRGSRPPRQ